jgi:RNA polymerase sigma factor (sigma-70 family)
VESVSTDRQLLDRFVNDADQAAFAILVRRHGGRVLAACQRVLLDPADVDDAFQATFLVLLRKVHSIRWQRSVGGWLAAVAHRVSVRARDLAHRRKRHEDKAGEQTIDVSLPADPSWREACAVLHEELDLMPDRYRLPLVLCYLEGLSRDEAAAQLGWSIGSVKGRLERGRHRLRRRLERRGIALSAGLMSFLASESRSMAPLTPIRVATSFASGTGPTIVVQALADAALRSTLSAPFALMGAMLVIAGSLALIIGVDHGSGTSTPIADAQSIARTIAADVKPAAEKPDVVEYQGRVLGPEGKPIAGAKVYYHCSTRADEPIPVRAVTDAEGRFSFSLGRKDVPQSSDAIESDPRRTGQVVAKAEGFTFAWQTQASKLDDVELRLLRDDAPIEGRFVDLQGKPAVGLRVWVQSAAKSKTDNLNDLLKAIKEGQSLYPAIFDHAPSWLNEPLLWRTIPGLLPAATTDADGRFRIAGFAREWAIILSIEGAGVENQTIFVFNRPDIGNRFLSPFLAAHDPNLGMGDERKVIVLANGFVHPVAPGQTIVGAIKDETSGEPIAGALVESYMLAGTNLAQNTIYHTVTDKLGRYRLEGLPRGKGNRIRIQSPENAAYLPVVKDVPTAVPFAEALVDAALRRGIRVDVSASDAATGQPVPGSVSYFAMPPKRTFMPLPGSDGYDNFMPTRVDGSLRFIVAPGKAIVALRTDWKKYPIPREAATIWLPSGLSPANYAAFAEINPNDGDRSIRVEFKLDAGRIVTGKLIGPDGNAVTGAWVAPLRTDFWFLDSASALKSEMFSAIGIDPARPRLLCFVQREKKLAGSIVVRGDETAPVTVHMQPWATISGRLLDANGKPITNARMIFTEVPHGKPDRPMSIDTGLHVVLRAVGTPNLDPKTDGNGRFHADSLVPGLKYNLALYDDAGAVGFDQIRWQGLAFRDLILKPSENRTLGDVKILPFPKE